MMTKNMSCRLEEVLEVVQSLARQKGRGVSGGAP